MKKTLIIISILFLVGCEEENRNNNTTWVVCGADTVKISNGDIYLNGVATTGGWLNDSVFYVKFLNHRQ